jgi:hypothetical protein
MVLISSANCPFENQYLVIDVATNLIKYADEECNFIAADGLCVRITTICQIITFLRTKRRP